MHIVPIRINVTDDTSPSDIDRYFTESWKRCGRNKINFVFDIRECRNISLGRLLGMRSVLNKHRANSREHIDHSTIVVANNTTKNILRMGLAIIRTERPVKVIKV
ncbi:hypothetical protein DSLPV1_191 [Dishui lake phycodnavirus 1]|uniref:hypothetical protein n=1 Tax=Dishui lake phycodnavirus 1 TaxID=2079134 RepID=UPI000CD69E9A|nr:hypothetical protein C5Y57_gp207 [Dishui lake phycodnavirus 1]AUT19162.1 hypothetical protein DSLPV1_191 [Dishui lake phycodnavirus 1]